MSEHSHGHRCRVRMASDHLDPLRVETSPSDRAVRLTVSGNEIEVWMDLGRGQVARLISQLSQALVEVSDAMLAELDGWVQSG